MNLITNKTDKMIKKLFAAVPIFSSALALRLMGDDTDGTMPGASTLEDPPLTSGDLSGAGGQDAGEQDSWDQDSEDSDMPEGEQVDMQFHVSEINGDPADDWYSVDIVIENRNGTNGTNGTNSTEPRDGGFCNNVAEDTWTSLYMGETTSGGRQHCMDDCINAGGSIEYELYEYEGGSSSSA